MSTFLHRAQRTALLALSFGLALVALAPLAHAADTISLSPVLIEKTLKPGETYEETVRVTNTGSTPVKLDKSVADFYYDPSGQIQFTEESEPPVSTASIKAWLKLDTDAFTLGPQETKQVTAMITVPTGAEPGGHYGVLFFNTVVDPSSGSTVKVAGRVGTLVLVEVPGDVRKTAEIKGFDVGILRQVENKTVFFHQDFYENGPVTFAYKVRNTGNVHFTPEGSIDIKNMFGTTVASIGAQVDEKSGKLRAFPGVEREFTRVWDPGFLLGRYTATVTVSDGTGKKLEPVSITFTVLPWKMLVGLILLLVIVISLVVTLIKRYNSWVISQAHKQRGS